MGVDWLFLGCDWGATVCSAESIERCAHGTSVAIRGFTKRSVTEVSCCCCGNFTTSDTERIELTALECVGSVTSFCLGYLGKGVGTYVARPLRASSETDLVGEGLGYSARQSLALLCIPSSCFIFSMSLSTALVRVCAGHNIAVV